MTNSALIAVPIGGLGNRLMSLLSLLLLGERQGVPTYCHWVMQHGRHEKDDFLADLDELWLTDVPTVSAAKLQEAWQGGAKTHSGKDLFVPESGATTIAVMHGALKWPKNELACPSWASMRELYLRRFRPAPVAAALIERLRATVENEPTVGMVVRCRGHRFTKRWQIPDRFRAWLTARAAESDTKFFLCCDDPMVSESLTAIAPRRIVSNEKPARLNTKEALQAVVADLELLRRCQEIYGTPASGLSWAASLIHPSGIWRIPKPAGYGAPPKIVTRK